MRDWPGINPATEADPIRRDKDAKIDFFLRDLTRGMQRISQGQAPDGSGGTIGVSDHGLLTGLADDDHAQYLLLAGRGGQTVADRIQFDAALTSYGISYFNGTTLLANPVLMVNHLDAQGSYHTLSVIGKTDAIQAGSVLRLTTGHADSVEIMSAGTTASTLVHQIAMSALITFQRIGTNVGASSQSVIWERADGVINVIQAGAGTKNMKLSGATAWNDSTPVQGDTLTLDFATVNLTGALTVSGSTPVHDHSDSANGGDALAPLTIAMTQAESVYNPFRLIGRASGAYGTPGDTTQDDPWRIEHQTDYVVARYTAYGDFISEYWDNLYPTPPMTFYTLINPYTFKMWANNNSPYLQLVNNNAGAGVSSVQLALHAGTPIGSYSIQFPALSGGVIAAWAPGLTESPVAGSLLVGSSGTAAMSELTIGSDGNVLTVVSGAVAWAPPATQQAFPIGAVFIAVVSTSPATLLGYGTWSAIGAGRVLVGLDSLDTDFDTVEETGGAKTVAAAGSNANESSHTHAYTQVLNHTHTVNITDPGHTHVENAPTAGTGGAVLFGNDTNANGSADSTLITGSSTTGISATTDNPAGGVASGTTGAGSAHTHTFTGSATSVVQPYFVVYMWKRTA